MNSTQLEDFGRVRSNPQAHRPNFMRFDNEICACPGLKACLDTVTKTVVANTTFVGFTFDGETFTPAVAIPVSNTSAILDFIVDKIGIKEFDLNIKVNLNGTTLTITHIGKLALTAVIFSDGTTTASRACVIEVHCEYKALVVGTVAPLVNGANSATLANNPYDFAGVPATDSATAATLKTDIEAALATLTVPYDSVTVTPNVMDESFEIAITAKEGTELAFGTTALKECNCAKLFIPAP